MLYGPRVDFWVKATVCVCKSGVMMPSLGTFKVKTTFADVAGDRT